MPNARNAIELFTQEALVARRAVHGHLDPVVVLAGDQIGFQHFGQRRELRAEARERVVFVAVERDFQNHDVGVAQFALVHECDIAFDIAVGFELARAVPARRGRHAHLLGEFGVGKARVLLERAQDLAVLVVERFGRAFTRAHGGKESCTGKCYFSGTSFRKTTLSTRKQEAYTGRSPVYFPHAFLPGTTHAATSPQWGAPPQPQAAVVRQGRFSVAPCGGYRALRAFITSSAASGRAKGI
ncbi:hypothetical protein PUN4_730003 [Paraburkholderia unamae]|nr:hypothetical protein PUN4_730003 [Paraburkholderia unamae]